MARPWPPWWPGLYSPGRRRQPDPALAGLRRPPYRLRGDVYHLARGVGHRRTRLLLASLDHSRLGSWAELPALPLSDQATNLAGRRREEPVSSRLTIAEHSRSSTGR